MNRSTAGRSKPGLSRRTRFRPGEQRVGLRRRPAVLPQVGEQRTARRRVPRHRRPAERHRAGRPQPDLEGVRAGGPEHRHPLQPRLQRRRAGRRRLLRRHPAKRPPREFGDRVPRTGAQAQEPGHRDARPGHPADHRERSGGGRQVPRQGQADRGAGRRGRRGRRLGRRGQLASLAAPVRDRTRRRAAQARRSRSFTTYRVSARTSRTTWTCI